MKEMSIYKAKKKDKEKVLPMASAEGGDDARVGAEEDDAVERRQRQSGDDASEGVGAQFGGGEAGGRRRRLVDADAVGRGGRHQLAGGADGQTVHRFAAAAQVALEARLRRLAADAAGQRRRRPHRHALVQRTADHLVRPLRRRPRPHLPPKTAFSLDLEPKKTFFLEMANNIENVECSKLFFQVAAAIGNTEVQ